MRPDAETNEAFVYCLAVAAERHGIEVLFTIAMSNHHHTGIFDPNGEYPAFLEYFHKLFAKCQNALRGRWENFWSSEQTSVVRLVDAEDVLNKLVYAVCNPVEAALVELASQWPGVSSLRPMLSERCLIAKRPSHFFREEGRMPEEAKLQFARPAELKHLSHEEWASLITDRVRRREKKLRFERAKMGRATLGVRAVLQQRWSSRPKSSDQRPGVSPRVKAINKWRRKEVLQENRSFLTAYHEARIALLSGLRMALFPPGTYWLKRFAKVVCSESFCPGR